MQDEIEPSQGENETNIGKLGKTQNYSLGENDYLVTSFNQLSSSQKWLL